jgi:hypothetical protein
MLFFCNNKKFQDVLNEILKQIEEDPKSKQTREACSNDMLRYVQTFLPLTMEIQFKIIAKYGFKPDNSGKSYFQCKQYS